ISTRLYRLFPSCTVLSRVSQAEIPDFVSKTPPALIQKSIDITAMKITLKTDLIFERSTAVRKNTKLIQRIRGKACLIARKIGNGIKGRINSGDTYNRLRIGVNTMKILEIVFTHLGTVFKKKPLLLTVI
ncbi:MAG TPA: hypothetical protein VJ821_09665, partial [Anaerolineales bacterium]|nr:hypothetical protein [Anaerolineales bacterium]